MSDNVNVYPVSGEKTTYTAVTFISALVAAVLFTIGVMSFLSDQDKKSGEQFSQLNLGLQATNQKIDQLTSNVNRIVTNFDNRINALQTKLEIGTANRFDEDAALMFSMELANANSHLGLKVPNPRKIRDYAYFQSWKPTIKRD